MGAAIKRPVHNPQALQSCSPSHTRTTGSEFTIALFFQKSNFLSDKSDQSALSDEKKQEEVCADELDGIIRGDAGSCAG